MALDAGDDDIQILTKVAPDPILLIDQTDDNGNDNSTINSSIWAKNVYITGYDVIQGGRSRTGGYVSWLIRIETLGGGEIRCCRRYSEFDHLRNKLISTYPSHINEIPELPPKSIIAKFRESFLEERRCRLEYFLLCILLNPLFMSCPPVKQFVMTT